MNIRKLLVLSLVAAPLVASATVTVYDDFASYDTAVGSVHNYFNNFDADRDGGSLLGGGGSISGDKFSYVATYSSPSLVSGDVNYADIGGAINVEIGPLGTWDGILRCQFASTYSATAMTGIDMEDGTSVNFFSGSTMVGSSAWKNVTGDVFDFCGFVSDTAWDSFEIDGKFYAIDAHMATSAVPEPATFAVLGLGIIPLLRRKRK